MPITDWNRFAQDIRADLKIKTADPDKSEHAFYLPTYSLPQGLSRLPVFPYSAAMTLPHLLMKVLTAQRDQFSNDTNCKNDNSIYNASFEEQVRMDAWGRRLDAWTVEAALRCANELGAIGTTSPWRGAVKHRYHWMDERTSDPQDTVVLAPAPMPLVPAAPEPQAQAPAKPISIVVFAVVFAVACLMILAFAHIVVRFPWLVIFFGLPLALYNAPKK